MFHHLLANVGEGPMFDQLHPMQYAGGPYIYPIRAYLYPSDSTHSAGMCQTTNGGANNWAAACYAGNHYVFGEPESGVAHLTRRRRGRPDRRAVEHGRVRGGVRDLREHRQPGDRGRHLWADASGVWRPAFDLSPFKGNVGGYPAARKLQVNPHYVNDCDFGRPRARTPAG